MGSRRAARLLIGMLPVFSAGAAQAQTTTFVDVNVVRLGQGDILPSQTVVVTDGRVTAVGPADPSSTAHGVTVNGRGRYLVPGLVVVNARLPRDNWLDWREALLVYLAHGVTTLGVSEAEAAPPPPDPDREWGIFASGAGTREALDQLARAQGEDVWPRPGLVSGVFLTSAEAATDDQAASHASGLNLPFLEGDPLAALRRHALDLSRSPVRVAEIELGAPGNLLFLSEDPLRDPAAVHRPLGVMVEGRWMPFADIAALARQYGEARRLWQAGRLWSTATPAILTLRSPPWPDESCVGQTLDECFGGDPDCGLHGILGWNSHLANCGAPSARADRQAVLDALDMLALVDPTDDWLVGQRVHFALMSGETDRAWTAAVTCASATWWCQALRGLVRHERSPGSAHAQFDSAYANSPEDTPAWSSPRIPEAGDRGLHCEWSDAAYLIDDPDLLASYRAEECGANVAFESRFWWLADPLWSQEGNERRDEHIARNIRMRIRDDYLRLVHRYHAHCVPSVYPPRPPTQVPASAGPSSVIRYYQDGPRPPTEDCARGHSAIIPFGLPNSWQALAHRAPYHYELVIGANGRIAIPPDDPSRRRSLSSSTRRDYTQPQLRVGHLNGGYSFAPDAGRFLDPVQSTASDWAVTWNEGHERMLTRETWYNLEHQTAVLRRGAQLEVLAAARFPESLPTFEAIEGFLAAGRVADRHVEVVPAEVDRVTGIMRASATLPDDEWLASIEALGPEVRGRARNGAPAPPLTDGYGMSDPVLVNPDFDLAQGALLQAMLPSKSLEEDERVGLYFELYGVEAGQDVEVTLAHDALEVRRSFLGRVASWIGIGRRSGQGSQLAWTEHVADVEDGVAQAFVAVDVRNFGAGEHRLTLTATAGGRTASGETNIHIRGSDRQ